MGAGPFTLALGGWLFMALVMVFLYFGQRARKDAGIVDVGWAGAMGLLAIFCGVMKVRHWFYYCDLKRFDR